MPRRSLLVLVLAILVVGCSGSIGGAGPQTARPSQLANGAVVDGIQVGDPIDCAASTNCAEALKFAETTAIKTGLLVSTSIADTSVYKPYVPDGMADTGGGYVVAYGLHDGSQVAIRVHCGVGPCQIVPLQPLINSLPTPRDYSNPESGSPAPDSTGGSGGTAEPHTESSP